MVFYYLEQGCATGSPGHNPARQAI